MLTLHNITKIFNRGTQDEKKALDCLSLEVARGDFVTIIGSNGAGKSTLLNVIAGTLRPDEGRILVDGQDVTREPEYSMAKYLARVFQDPAMGTAGEMTIEENLCLAELRGKKRGLRWGVTRSRRSRYRQALSVLDMGLEDRLRDKVGLLSGGQRQVLAVLMATLSMPRVLLLDEHTAALDPRMAEKVMELTDRLVREHRLTTLMVTHNMHQALRYGSRMIMLHQGRIQLAVAGEQKKQLGVNDILARFGHSLKDETLLCPTEEP
ncbi:MAG: ABC transporter ATP-binding protein [Deltaproteobacteria bacterium]|nr:ABC transporter ATP-binding protein [Deltaproteobacteria bacterium]MBW2072731.1 ABC transporter ATP-binding protein [Deltaproteobacteria bacterium]